MADRSLLLNTTLLLRTNVDFLHLEEFGSLTSVKCFVPAVRKRHRETRYKNDHKHRLITCETLGPRVLNTIQTNRYLYKITNLTAELQTMKNIGCMFVGVFLEIIWRLCFGSPK